MKKSKNLKLVGISMLIIVGLAACDKPRASQTAVPKSAVATSVPPNEISTISRNTFRIFDNPEGYTTYINTEPFKDLDLGKNMREGFVLLNHNGPQQANNGDYRSELQLLMVTCDEKKVIENLMVVKGWYAAGLNMSGKIVGHSSGQSVLTPDAESEMGLIRSLLCFPQKNAETVFSGAAQNLGSRYPATITIDTSQFDWRIGISDNNKQTPREMAIAPSLKLAQYAVDFAKSANPTCQSISTTLNSTARKAGGLIETADSFVQQGQSGTEVYETARNVANAGLDTAASVGNCP